MAHKLTTCTFCGVGCGIYLETAADKVMGAYPSMSHPSNQGRICVRGWNVHEVASSPDRLKSPLIRRNGRLESVGWDEAIGFIAARLSEIRTNHGPDALAFYNSPRCSNEETYLLQKLARAVIGTNNVDHGTGVYSNNSIQVLLDMIGLPATTNSIGELAQSEVLVVDGVDLGMQLPTIGGWVIRAKLKGAKLIVIDARRHRVAEQADYFLQVKPGTRVWLYGAMAKVIVDRGLMDHAFIKNHCHDYETYLAAIHDFDLLSAAAICGVPASMIEAAALTYAQASGAALLYSTGVESRSKASIRSLVNLALLTGNVGKAGSGIYALTEHNNLQGVCDMGMLPDRLPGYESLQNEVFRRKLEMRWDVTLPVRPGIGARNLLESEDGSKVKALWLCRYDPVTTATFCDADAAMKRFDFIVVQHLFMTRTAEYADVILPLVAFGEERVSFTSTDRRIQLAEQVIDPPAGPRPAWRQVTDIARALGADWNYSSAADIMDEIGEVVPFYSGASYENLARDYGRQWPCTKDKPLGTRFLYEDGLSGRPFRFVPVSRPAAIQDAGPDYPLTLIFGHSLYYWHQNILVKHSETLRRELRVLLLDYPDGFVEISEADAKALGIRDGAKIRVVSSHGSAVTDARVTGEVRSGTICVPFFVREVVRQILGETLAEAGLAGQPVFVRIEKI